MRIAKFLSLIFLCFGCVPYCPVRAITNLGYTAESCDDLKPAKVPFIQDLAGNNGYGYSPDGTPIINHGQNGFNNPGFNNHLVPSPNGPISNNPMNPMGGNIPGTNLQNIPANMVGSLPRPDGINYQPVLMTTLAPYRIFTSENRYKRGKAMEGMCAYALRRYTV